MSAEAPEVGASSGLLPVWIESSLELKPGRDPLGLMTITEDGIMPALVPGILQLSRRARYFSFYPFLIQEYARGGGRASNQALSQFIKHREYEYALAAQHCERCDARGANGARRAGRVYRQKDGEPFARAESVDSHLGGYGLYYRTPLSQLEVVARAGRALGEGVEALTTPVDVLEQNERAPALAESFRNAIGETTYYKQYFRGLEPIPGAVLAEYAEASCLCRLDDAHDERSLIREALFTPARPELAEHVEQRRRSVALLLDLLTTTPRVMDEDGALRNAVWTAFVQGNGNGTRAHVLAQWAALVAKEWAQEALASIFFQVCLAGLHVQAVTGGLTRARLRQLLREELIEPNELVFPAGRVVLTPGLSSAEFTTAVIQTATATSLEDLRTWAAQHDTALAGLALLLVLCDRLPGPDTAPDAFQKVARVGSEHQPGVAILARQIALHLEMEPAPQVADTLEWLVATRVLVPHEQIAYGKLREGEFTFRYRHEAGQFVFYRNGVDERFNLAGNRRDPIASLTEDLGYWQRGDDGGAALTTDGSQFVREALG